MTMVNRAVTLYVKDETTGTEDTKTGTVYEADYPFPSPTTIKLFGDARKVASGVTIYESYIKVNGEYVWQSMPVRVGTQVELLDLVNWQFATRTGTFTAGADIPYSELCPDILETNVGDVIWSASKNLFDKTTIKTGYYLDDSGAEITHTRWSISDYMPVVGGETYYQTLNSAGNAPRTCWYDANKTFISAVMQKDGGTQTAPTNAKYCKMSIRDTEVDVAMFTHGADAPTKYEPFYAGLHPSGEQRVVTESYNLFDIAALTGSSTVSYSGSTITISETNVDTGKTLHELCPDLKAGDTCYLYMSDSSTTPNKYIWLRGGAAGGQWNKGSTKTISQEDLDGKVKMYCGSAGQTIVDMMIVKGTTAPTSYSSYAGTSQVRTITTFLPSATSFIDAQKASNNCSCDWAFKVLDGTETGWNYSSTAVTGHNVFTLSIDDTSKDNGFVPLSTVYEGKSASTPFSALANGQFKHASSSTTYYFVDDRFDNVTAFKAWLAENLVILCYLVTTPEVTTVAITPFDAPRETEYTMTTTLADGTAGNVQVTFGGEGGD